MPGIGLIGYGTIGQYLAERIQSHGHLALSFIHDADPAQQARIPAHLWLDGPAGLPDRRPDLVVEVAHASAVRAWGQAVLEYADLLMYSVTALADPVLEAALQAAVASSGRRLLIPHGAIAGLDAIAGGRGVWSAVSITTVKPPSSLGRSDTERTVLYAGPTRDVCRLFPRNVNVHAAVAAVGIGFDRTVSRLVSDPAAATNAHLIEAEGPGTAIRIQVEARPFGQVTGVYTPAAAFETLLRVTGRAGITVA